MIDLQLPVEITREQEVVWLCARQKLTPPQHSRLTDLVNQGPDWGRVFEVALFNKVLPLVAYHMLQYSAAVIPGIFRRQCLFMYLGNTHRNQALMAELGRIVSALRQRNIKHSPLKGSYLIPHVYQDQGMRLCNDLDILIHFENIQATIETLESLGYVMGEYDDPSGSVRPISRTKDLFWKLHMGNIHPFVRPSADPFLGFSAVDIAFDVDPVHKNEAAALEMLARCREIDLNGFTSWLLAPEDFLIHVCTHLYKEACSEFASQIYMQLNLIKFCDLRELVLHDWCNADQHQLDRLVARAIELKCEYALLYGFQCLAHIYGESYATNILDLLKLEQDPVGRPPEPGSVAFWRCMFPAGAVEKREIPELKPGLRIKS